MIPGIYRYILTGGFGRYFAARVYTGVDWWWGAVYTASYKRREFRMALKIRTMKIDDPTWEGWQVAARAAGKSVTQFIVERVNAETSVGGRSEDEFRALEAALADARSGQGSRPAEDAFKPFRDEIAALKEALAVARPKSGAALAALRADPANRIIDPKASQSVGHPVLVDPVPRAVIGEAIRFNLKGKGKS